MNPRTLLVSATLLLGCASRPASPTSPPPPSETPQPAAPAHDELVSWRPGDAEAVAQEVQRWTAPTATPAEGQPKTTPVTWHVEIRNRCEQPVSFVVGPRVDTPPADAPINTLEPARAIATGLRGDEQVYLRDATGGIVAHATAAKYLVFMPGDDPQTCDRIATEDDDG